MTTNQTTTSPLKKVMRKSLYIFLAVIALLLIVAIFLPKQINMSVKGEINAPKNYVFNLLNDQRNVSLWNDWVKTDKGIKLNFTDKNIGLGSNYSWHSESFGDGSIKYIDIKENEKITAELVMDGDKSTYTQSLSEENSKTKIDWTFQSNMSYPTNIMAPLFKYMMRKSYKKCIVHIQDEMAKRTKGIYNNFQVKEEGQNAKYFITSRSKVSFDNISQFYTQTITSLYQRIQNEGISTIGVPTSLFYTYDEFKKETDMAVGVQVLNPVNIKDLSSESLPAQNAVIVDYFGDFSKTGEGHIAIDAYMKDRNMTQAMPVLEEYLTDPIKEKDMSKWQTKIYYFVKSAK